MSENKNKKSGAAALEKLQAKSKKQLNPFEPKEVAGYEGIKTSKDDEGYYIVQVGGAFIGLSEKGEFNEWIAGLKKLCDNAREDADEAVEKVQKELDEMTAKYKKLKKKYLAVKGSKEGSEEEAA